MATVQSLWRYLVKSMAGEDLDALAFDSRGAAGDRMLAVRTASGKIASGKNTRRFERVDGLLACHAFQSGDAVRVRLPDGSEHGVDNGAALTEALGRPLDYVREAAVPHFDAGAVHIVGGATLRWLGSQSGAPTDARRLRPNMVVDTGTTPFAEDEWIGSELQIGSARFRVLRATERCVMTTFAQHELPQAPEVMRTITRERNAQLGVYAEVVVPGDVRVGDRVKQA